MFILAREANWLWQCRESNRKNVNVQVVENSKVKVIISEESFVKKKNK